MRNPKPFTVYQPVPGQSPKPLFTVHAYSIEAARALVAAKVAGAKAMRWYDAEKPGASRMAIGNAIRIMARARKSREGDHFAAAIGLRSMLEQFAPTIPDWANDRHTLAGKKLGRGLDHFRKEGARLIPEPTADDPYEGEAYRLWAIKQQRK